MSDLRFFDANVVIGRISRPLPTTPIEPDDTLAELARHDVHEVLVTSSHALERSIEDNEELLDFVAAHPGTRPVYVIPQHSALDFPDPDTTVASWIAAGVAAVRVVPSRYNGYTVDPWALGPIWSRLNEARLPVLLQNSDLGRYPDQPGWGFSAKNIYDTAKAFSELPIVILRTNWSSLRVLIPLMKECPNIYAENSFFTAHRGVEAVVEAVGAERMVYGSGLPWGPPGPGIVATRFALIDEADKALIAGDNLRRLIGAIRG